MVRQEVGGNASNLILMETMPWAVWWMSDRGGEPPKAGIFLLLSSFVIYKLAQQYNIWRTGQAVGPATCGLDSDDEISMEILIRQKVTINELQDYISYHFTIWHSKEKGVLWLMNGTMEYTLRKCFTIQFSGHDSKYFYILSTLFITNSHDQVFLCLVFWSLFPVCPMELELIAIQ